MRITVDREDNFADITRKGAAGRKVSPRALAASASIDPARLEELLAERSRPTETEARAVARALQLNPDKLADIGCRDWRPRAIDLSESIGHQINAPYPSNGYFLMADDRMSAAFVDPGGAAANIVSVLERESASLEYILLTHKHPDHVDAVTELRKAYPKARVVIHPLDAAAIGEKARGALDVADGETIAFGSEVIQLVHTPGHTDGSSCFRFRDLLFTGDTLFAGSVGKLFGERFGYEDLLRNVSTKILSLPIDTVLLPGHGPPTTVEQEREHNPFF